MNNEQFPKIYLYRRIVKAKLFIDAHYNEDINLNNCAGEAFFSKFHFIRTFSAIYGKTPHQYLTLVRIENAKLILKTKRSVSDVCFMVGFTSVSSFTALFKRHTGMTPYAYQIRQHQLLAEIKARPLRFIPNCFVDKNGWLKNSNFQEA